jgi:hypothetical protein
MGPYLEDLQKIYNIKDTYFKIMQKVASNSSAAKIASPK